MKIIPTELPGVLIVEPQVYGDARGFFLETWNRERYEAAGLAATFVQDNVSFSGRGVLRGLHYQYPHPQAKLIYVLEGEVFDVAVDIRPGSPTRGRWVGVTLSSKDRRQLYIPEGFAHGFVVTSESALFAYKCTDIYHPECEGSVLWNDPALGIEWPVSEPTLSARDQAAPRLEEIPEARLLRFPGSGDGAEPPSAARAWRLEPASPGARRDPHPDRGAATPRGAAPGSVMGLTD